MSLIHWWPLTGDLKDKIAGVNLVKTTTGSASFITAGKIGTALASSDTYRTPLTLNDINPLTNHSFSFACWIKINQAEIQTIFNTLATTYNIPTGSLLGYNHYGGIALTWKANSLADFQYIQIGGTMRGSSVLNTPWGKLPFDQWSHLALTQDTNSHIMRLYLNGTQIGQLNFSSLTTIGNNSQNIFINHSSISSGNGPSTILPCYLNDVRIYNHALSQAEIKELTKALVLHYTFDDILIEKNMLYNETGLTQHTVINNTMLNKTDAAIGKYSLNCNNTYISIPITGDITQGATASMWVKTPTYPTVNQVVFADYTSKLAFGFYDTQNAIISCGGSQVGVINDIKAMWKESAWNHVVIMRNTSNQVSCYLNGEQLTLSNITNNWTTTEDCIIGCRNNGTYNTYFNGLVDDIRLYYTQLSPEEIKELYNCGGRISNLGDALTGSFIEGAAAIKINKNHTIETDEIIEQDEAKASFKKDGTIFTRQIIEI